MSEKPRFSYHAIDASRSLAVMRMWRICEGPPNSGSSTSSSVTPVESITVVHTGPNGEDSVDTTLQPAAAIFTNVSSTLGTENPTDLNPTSNGSSDGVPTNGGSIQLWISIAGLTFPPRKSYTNDAAPSISALV